MLAPIAPAAAKAPAASPTKPPASKPPAPGAAQPGAPADQPQTPPPPPQLALFTYQPSAAKAQAMQAPALLWQLLPGREGVHPIEPVVNAGADFGVAMKMARARAGVAAANQAQAILKNASDGAYYVTGLAHLAQDKPGKDGTHTATVLPAIIDGETFAKSMAAVSVAKVLADMQAVVGTSSWVDLRTAAAGVPVAFAAPAPAPAPKAAPAAK